MRLEMSPLGRYNAAVEAGLVVPDPAQRGVVGRLEELWQGLGPHLEGGWGVRLKRRLGMGPPLPKGIYLWGGVGRGKTWLMDMFYDCLPGERKQRTHFHRFMQDVHRQLAARQGEAAPLEKIAAAISRRVRVLCFDEFFVEDIGDAMILAGLLRALFARRVCLVATSNCHPDRLYADGLQRQRFLPAIAMLHAHTEVLELGGGTDYRLRRLRRARLYHSPLGPEADAALQRLFKQLAGDPARISRDCTVDILGRPLPARYCADDMAWFDFAALCAGPRSAFDYVELARLYHSIILSDTPALDDSTADQVRRLISLVDTLYDRRVKLILSAAVPLSRLYQGRRLAFEFQRTQSRLLEMQSQSYLAASRQP